MNSLDSAISTFINRPAQHWPAFDEAIVFLTNSDLMKGGLVVGAVWAMWFYESGDRRANRAVLLGTVFGSLVALFLARVLAFCAPMRVRPLLEPTMHFQAPTGLPAESNWTSWSSFPSDHAALFVALSFGVWCVSRRAGLALLAYVFVIIVMPRLYVGIHYPSDIIAGALVGIAVVAVLTTGPVVDRVFGPILRWGEQHPTLFYLALYLLTFQIATLFWDVRVALSLLGFST